MLSLNVGGSAAEVASWNIEDGLDVVHLDSVGHHRQIASPRLLSLPPAVPVPLLSSIDPHVLSLPLIYGKHRHEISGANSYVI